MLAEVNSASVFPCSADGLLALTKALAAMQVSKMFAEAVYIPLPQMAAELDGPNKSGAVAL